MQPGNESKSLTRKVRERHSLGPGSTMTLVSGRQSAWGGRLGELQEATEDAQLGEVRWERGQGATQSPERDVHGPLTYTTLQMFAETEGGSGTLTDPPHAWEMNLGVTKLHSVITGNISGPIQAGQGPSEAVGRAS